MFHSIARLSLRYSSRLFFSIGLLVAVIGCGSSDDSSNPESGYLQVINGLNDSPDLKLGFAMMAMTYWSIQVFWISGASALLALNEGVYLEST